MMMALALSAAQAFDEDNLPVYKEPEPFSFLSDPTQPVDFLSVSASAGGLVVPFITGAPLWEMSISGNAHLGIFRIEGGYRGLWTDVDSSTMISRLSLRGPFLGVSIGF